MSYPRQEYQVKRGRVCRLRLNVQSDPDNVVTGNETVVALAKPIDRRGAEIPDDSVAGVPLNVTYADGGWLLEWTEAQTEALTSDYYVLDCRIDLSTGAPMESAITLEVVGRVTGPSA